MASLDKDVLSYERWLRTQCDVVEADLEAKRQRMRESPFVFLRATYFRWARRIWSYAPELKSAPSVLCVGDAHVENFGTWRDGDARQVWGVNDFDDAAEMPYALDLLRLAVSARLSEDGGLQSIEIEKALVAGYVEGLFNPRPLLLEHGDKWFRALVSGLEDKSKEFWKEVDDYPGASPPSRVQRLLVDALPNGAKVLRFATRRKGGGGLGRPRFLVVAKWRGGHVIREAKAAVPSAWNWARDKWHPLQIIDLAQGRFRSPDTSLTVSGGFIIRRIAPDARKLDLSDVAPTGRSEGLLVAMASELASIHAASRRASQIADDIFGRPRDWLREAAGRAESAVRSDHAQWMKSTSR